MKEKRSETICTLNAAIYKMYVLITASKVYSKNMRLAQHSKTSATHVNSPMIISIGAEKHLTESDIHAW